MRKYIALVLVMIITITSCEIKTNTDTKKKPKNIILLIGDGMGVAQIYAAMSVSEKPLVFEEFKHIGFHKTHSASDYVTDSGAGATAFSTGKRTTNHYIAMDTEKKPLKSIVEYVEEVGMLTGLISTSSVTHATPAAFYAHDTSRYNYENIAYDFLDSGIDILIGGGKKYFQSRRDSLNLIDSLIYNDYKVVNSIDELSAENNCKNVFFTAEKHNPSILEGRGNMLAESTGKAIDIMQNNENGFFLMVEGSQIDWGGEDNDIDYVITEILDFEKAITVALEFARKDKETLVIVTGDHETGGLALNEGDLNNKTIEAAFTRDDHTGVMVPVFTYGPRAVNFQGIYENVEIFNKMLKSLSIKKES